MGRVNLSGWCLVGDYENCRSWHCKNDAPNHQINVRKEKDDEEDV